MSHEPKHPDLIYRPDLVPKGRRVLFSGITLLAWGVWSYLFLPLLSLLFWWLGVDLLRFYVLTLEQAHLVGALQAYGLIIAAAGVVIIGWSKYQGVRFRDHDRRNQIRDVTPEMLCERFQVDRPTLDCLHNEQVVELHLDAQGKILSVVPRLRQLPEVTLPDPLQRGQTLRQVG